MPVLLERVDEVGVGVAALSETEEVFFREAVRDVVFGENFFAEVGAGAGDEGEHVWDAVGRRGGAGERTKEAADLIPGEELIAEVLAVVGC